MRPESQCGLRSYYGEIGSKRPRRDFPDHDGDQTDEESGPQEPRLPILKSLHALTSNGSNEAAPTHPSSPRGAAAIRPSSTRGDDYMHAAGRMKSCACPAVAFLIFCAIPPMTSVTAR